MNLNEIVKKAISDLRTDFLVNRIKDEDEQYEIIGEQIDIIMNEVYEFLHDELNSAFSHDADEGYEEYKLREGSEK